MVQGICSILDCGRSTKARRCWCDLCYQRWYHHGDPTYVRSIEMRFWDKVDPYGPVPDFAPQLGPCWLWTAGAPPPGYGIFSVGSRSDGIVRAHRFAYERWVGPIPDGLIIDHLCRVRRCVRPAHLEPVTNRENVCRGIAARRDA